METLKNLEDKIKNPNRSQDDIINYLLASKNEMKQESLRFAKTDEFQKIVQKLRGLNKK